VIQLPVDPTGGTLNDTVDQVNEAVGTVLEGTR
jgi:hypothetical protein